MKLEYGYAKFMDGECDELSDGIRLLKKIEYIGRISHRSEERVTESSWKPFIQKIVIEHGDWSIVEHVNISVEAVMDRGVHTEWIRHRLGNYYDPIGAYTAESTRFVNYTKKGEMEFVPSLDTLDNNPQFNESWHRVMTLCEDEYNACVQAGIKPELARELLPLAKSVKMVTTYNLRQWRHLLLMRTSRETLQKYRELMIPLLINFRARIPLLFDDVVPMESQRDNMRKMH